MVIFSVKSFETMFIIYFVSVRDFALDLNKCKPEEIAVLLLSSVATLYTDCNVQEIMFNYYHSGRSLLNYVSIIM